MHPLRLPQSQETGHDMNRYNRLAIGKTMKVSCRESSSLSREDRLSGELGGWWISSTLFRHVFALINSLIIETTSFIESLLTSLCQKEVLNPSLAKRGKGRFSDFCKFNFNIVIVFWFMQSHYFSTWVKKIELSLSFKKQRRGAIR